LFAKFVGVVVIGILLVTGVGLLFAFPIMWLVNYLFTPNVILSIFGVTALTFWKAYWLSLLCSLLFKSVSASSK
jgi:hypothetical protein